MAAVLRTGSFKKAAHQLHITASAVSQRVKALEERLGVVLIIRDVPCRPTDAGTMVAMHFERVSLLEHSLQSQLSIGSAYETRKHIRIAVNADSLETWFLHALERTQAWLFDLVVDDQHHSAEWLSKGMVAAAVTADSNPVSGCNQKPLGALRYVAVCSPAFRDKWFPNGLTIDAVQAAPALLYGKKDELHSEWLAAKFQRKVDYPFHLLSSTHAITKAALLGLGWSLMPKALIDDQITSGRMINLAPNHPWDIPLYWQWSRAVESALAQLNSTMVVTARSHLLPLPIR